ncbi:MAG: hypothetical protein OXT06_28515 [Rhodospirillaceae bacterium]|nr:hypothetical protein [Rhodospirillaceae bacterium]MDD9924905.1 hypothetical protein [Rhodospirillaceae bacterium]
MSNPSADPVPSIREADATGDIAALYDDIRATLGVPVVNLIWRHLAMFPGGLDWAWTALKPLYASGAITAEAAALRDGLAVPTLPGLTGPALSVAGLTPDDISQIDMILASYEQSNAMNIIALGALAAYLDGTGAAQASVSDVPLSAPPVEGTMPPLLTLDEMSPDVRALVEALNTVGGRAEILASMYRHLANWPPYLGLLSALVTPVDRDGRLEPVILGVIAEGRRRASGLAGALAIPEKRLEASVEDDMRAALNRFIDGPIGKMIAVVPLIKQAMPN